MEYVECDIPEVKPNEVLLRVVSVGICGTDIHAYAGRQPFFSYPRVLGHEISGQIEVIGADCKKFTVGDRVCVVPCVSCGKCPACKDGKTNCCEKVSLYGVHQDGGFTEYLTVYENNLVKIPDDVSMTEGSLVECFSIGAHGVRRAQLKKGENVIVVGAGPIGIGTAANAKASGAHVVVSDVAEARRANIENKVGLKTLNPLDSDYIEQIRQTFNGQLADVLIDATGNKGSMGNAVNYIRHGGRIVFLGLFIGELVFDDPTFHSKETTLLASRTSTPEDFERVLDLMSTGEITEDMMVNREYDFFSFGHTYKEDVVEDRELVKGVINFKGKS